MKRLLLGVGGVLAVSAMLTGCKTESLVINEYKANIPEDVHSKQYIELRGTPLSQIEKTYLVVIDGDEDEEGKIDYAYNLDGIAISSNGLIIIKNENEYNDIISPDTTVINDPAIRTYDPDVDGDEYEDGVLEHDAVTYLLIKTDADLKRGDDLDLDNDGVLDLPEGAVIIDSLGSLDGGDGFVYSDVVLTQSASDPDAATRFYDDMTPNSLTAWANGDIYEDPNKEDEELPDELLYDTLQASSNLPPKAALTPGNHNFNQAPFILLNEIAATGDKYVELLSNSAQSFDNVYLLVSNEADGTVANSTAMDGIIAKETGITIITDTSAAISVGTAITQVEADLSSLKKEVISIVLVYSPESAIAAGDSITDLPEGAIVLDNIGWGGSVYSDIVSADSATTAIRYKDNKMVTMSAWSFEEQHRTPANTNIAEVATMIVKPVLETQRTTQPNFDADDMAFWINSNDPTNGSMVIATQKIAGYSVYDVEGNTLIDVKPEGIRFNNVDVMYGFELNGELVDLAIFTDRGTNKFAIYTISTESPYLTEVTDYGQTEELFAAEEAGEDTAYGLAVYKSVVDGKFYAYATQNGYNLAAQFELKAMGDKIGWEKVRTITLAADDDDKHAEGMVVDQEYGKLYIGQEEVGVYITDAEAAADTVLTEDDLLLEEGDYNIVEDIEGMTIYYKDNGEGYVMISSQGNYSFGVFNRTPNGVTNGYVSTFIIADDMNGIDGVQETDSLDVTNCPIGTQFPHGALIVQDGMDTTPDPDDTETNFKWVKWEDVAAGLGDISFESDYDPRNPIDRR